MTITVDVRRYNVMRYSDRPCKPRMPGSKYGVKWVKCFNKFKLKYLAKKPDEDLCIGIFLHTDMIKRGNNVCFAENV